MGYTFIDHTGDVAADLTGGSLEELFVSAAGALTDTITDRAQVRSTVSAAVTLEAPTLEDLLVDWLNELLYQFEVRSLLVGDAQTRVTRDRDKWQVSATVRGEPFDAARHVPRVMIKSATYYGLHVEQRGGEWRARIVFDI